MKIFVLLVISIIFTSGCIYKPDENITLLPREYYRPIISIDEVGVAHSNREHSEALIPILLNNDKISDTIFITHDDVTLLGVRFKPYQRNNDEEFINEIQSSSPIRISSIIVDPRKYRIMERLSKEKQNNEINEHWIREWSRLQE